MAVRAVCNTAAAEFLMPMGSIGYLPRPNLEIDNLLKLRQNYDVSTKAILLRAIHVANWPRAAFSASRTGTSGAG